jgi:hypothetical protein
MYKTTTTAVALLIGFLSFSQAMYRVFPSDILGEDRQIKVLKPRNYSSNPEKTYPLIIVLDGDYLFEPVAGNVDYLSFWDQIPESFVVGLNQAQSRYDDTSIDFKSGLPSDRAQKFMDFIMEIRETMLEEYRVAPFTVVVGKDLTANLAAFFLMRKKVAVDGFIQIAPEYTTIIEQNLINKIGDQTGYNYFYVATPEKQGVASPMLESITDSLFMGKKNVNIKHEQIEGTNKYNVATVGIARGLQYIFQEYGIIDEQELYKEGMEEDEAAAIAEENGDKQKKKTKKEENNLVERLLDKYKMIKEVYGVEMKLRLVDVATIANYLEEREDWDQIITLGELADKEFPTLLYGNYLQGKGYEKIGREPRALKLYNIAYSLEPAAGITPTDILDRIDALQEFKD